MDLTPFMPWIVFIHVAAAFVFAAGHGVTMYVAFAVRREKDRAKMAALLDMSGWALTSAGIAVLVVLLVGILAGVVAGDWNRLWIGVSLVLFIAIGAAMTPIGGAWFNKLRVALGQRTRTFKPGDADPVPVSDGELAALQATKVPEQLLVIGGGGFLVILYLMMFRPF
jgi:hypothetical protein